MFGAEYIVTKIGMETLRGLRYKLCMMGVPIFGPLLIYGDNMSVIQNTQRLDSTLKKKSNSIYYHVIRESVAMSDGVCVISGQPVRQFYGGYSRQIKAEATYP